ncbi:Cytochrome P450 [Micromonospora rhizosphaerae]|uniref:Cytochrome P450 n=1 Tax=Micromonospora rhizosphaerae TaxID=568872 RepID=A0A1C6SK10_9ACTN|nr:cytochrome P450 [Micromonospora rhizosphaerae]SCL29589.1 Cytochrome P450 [Micromonospora rhizosphaerae]
MDSGVIFDPDTYTRRVPYEEFARLREAAPVSWVEGTAVGPWSAGPGFWAVWRHADVKAVLRNPKVFSSYLGATQIRDPATPADLAYVRQMMLNMDPPVHSRLRRLLARAFTPRAVAALQDRINARARELVAAVPDDGVTDFVKVAADLPLCTLADVLGVPGSDRYLLFDWANRVIGYQDPEYSTSDLAATMVSTTPMAQAALAVRPKPDGDGRMPDPRTRAGIPDLYAYAHEFAAQKRRNPGEDIMSILLQQVDDEDGRVSVEEFENLFWLFAVAGNETLRNGIPGGMAALLAHADQWERLDKDRTLLGTAVEEMLRWWTPVVHFRRTTTIDTTLGGVDIKAGDKVVVYFASANRDPRAFPSPEAFDVGRSPNDHLAFGHGPHFCLGAALGRHQMKAMFAAVLDRFAAVEPAGEAVRLRSNFQNGLKRLPVRFTPR